jgi:hypothetical protein
VAPAKSQRRLRHEERHVTAKTRRELQQLVPGHGVPRELVHREECSRAIARASAKARANRDALDEVKSKPERVPDGIEHGRRGAEYGVVEEGPVSAPSTVSSTSRLSVRSTTSVSCRSSRAKIVSRP